jgi:hypothetical protein
MRDTHRIAGVRISTRSTRPLRGIVEIDTTDATHHFELTEETAHDLCTQIERFLTQVVQGRQSARRAG